MIIGERLKQLRELKGMSQGHIEKRTGLLRCYISRVENGHTVPAIETLEKMARALDIPLYQLFYDGEKPPKQVKGLSLDDGSFTTKQRREIETLGRQFVKLKDRDRGLVRLMIAKLAQAAS